MADVNDIHLFYEANVPGYQRKDMLALNKFFLELMGIQGKPIANVLKHFDWFKNVVCVEWHGTEVQDKPAPKASQQIPKKNVFVMAYGKHKGERMEDIDINYLIWLRDNQRATPPVLKFLKIKNR